MSIQTQSPARAEMIVSQRFVRADAPARRRNRTAYLFLLPYLVIFILFLLLPAIAGFGVSFTDWRILGDPHWVGFDNFVSIFKDQMFWQAFRNTLSFTGLRSEERRVG